LQPSAEEQSKRPTLVVVGRPNVGKSTLFNRITRSRRAIVGNQPGITRDRIRMQAQWRDKRFELIDTGGMTFGVDEPFPVLTNEQVRKAIQQATHVLFVVDGRAEITAADRDVAQYLRETGRPVTVAVNKCDVPQRDDLAAAFFELGLGEPVPISAEHDRNVASLLDRALSDFPGEAPEEEPEEGAVAEEPARLIRVAIIGRPNTGKSTLLNRLTGGEHAIVSPIAGTTRDAVDVTVERDGVEFQFVDTAGIRKKGKTTEMAEKLSVVMAQRHVRMADVALMLIDAREGLTQIDGAIAGYAEEAGRAIVIVVNKWDQIKGKQQAEFRLEVRDSLKYLDYAPIVFISALTGEKTDSLFPLVRKVYRESRKRITTGELNRFVETVDFDRATVKGFKKPRIYYVTQARIGPPTFIFFTNRDEPFHFSFERFLLNQLRERFSFEGAPIRIKNRLSRKKKKR
jgi:GTP-binding protein